MARSPFILCALAALCNSVYGVTVFQGLRTANASLFAEWIEQDPSLSALYNSSQTQTVFAPNDAAFSAYNQSGNLPQLRRLLLRQTVVTVAGALQCSSQLMQLSELSQPDGTIITTNSQSAAANRQQVVVAQSRSNGTTTSSQRKRQSNDLTTNPLLLVSGLGNNVSVVQADTAYDGGVIQTLDGFFTVPESFTSTFAQTNATSFASGLSQTGLVSGISNSTGVTVFSTSNEVYQAGVSQNTSTSSLTSVLSNHIIPNFLGYTPSLTNGTVLTTQSGNKLTVTISNGEWYINNAKIIAPDQITTNGVAHVVDSLILTTTSPSVPVYTGGASANNKEMKAGMIVSTVCALLAWFI